MKTRRLAATAALAMLFAALLSCSSDSDDIIIPSLPDGDLAIQFEGFDPHVGQLFRVRVVDTGSGITVGCKEISPVPSPTFTVFFSQALTGGDYDVEYFADMNGSGGYDPPPTDHAWRVDLGVLSGDADITLPHDTNFVDVGFTETCP
jgi:hypothetical protein